MKENIKNYNLEELKEELKKIGEKPFRAEQIFKWLYQEKVTNFNDMTNISIDLRNKLEKNYRIGNFKIVKKLESIDGTKKYLFDVGDTEGNLIESVLMEYHHGYTICVSSQIGCKMGCKFCASTGIPFARNLESGEIIEQLLEIERDEKIKISNIVFMGIGEPLDNFDNVMNAISILNNPKGLNIGARHISISTSGVVPRIYELADRKMNNDNLEDAKKLVELLKGMLAHVNLIPINKIEDGNYTKSTNENIIKFRDYLNDHGIVATIRRELGSDINAACGQLRKQNLK